MRKWLVALMIVLRVALGGTVAGPFYGGQKRS